MPTEMEDYLFDLKGYIILKQAIEPDHVAELNAVVDDLLPIEPGEWRGYAHRAASRKSKSNHMNHENFFIQNIYEAGEPFERLVDHPSWIDHVTRYVGGDDGLFIDEGVVSLRGQGQGLLLHSGAHKRRIRTQFRYKDGFFRCGQVNVLMALTDIREGDGATMVIPGSHKSNLIHPAFADRPSSLDEVPGAVEVHLEAGDALLFVDCLAHGAARRTSQGTRRMTLYRYGPHWGKNRYGYEISEELLARLTPERKKILQPLPPRRPPTA